MVGYGQLPDWSCFTINGNWKYPNCDVSGDNQITQILLNTGAVFAKPLPDGKPLYPDASSVKEKVPTKSVVKPHLFTNRLESHAPYIRRRGALPKHRRKKCDSEEQLIQKLEARKLRDEILEWLLLKRAFETFELNRTLGNNSYVKTNNRTKRWADYDPDYNWENGGKDYSLPGEEKKKESKLERFAKSWQKHTLKVIFAFSFCCMILCCCAACCKKICGRLCGVCCWHCKEWRDICLNRDPTYRKIRSFADDYGLQIDHDQYQKLKGNYEEALKKQGHIVDFSGKM